MEDTPHKRSVKDYHDEHREAYWDQKNWRSWGSWFSWGSPVGLGLLYALVAISTGVYLWLSHH